MDEITYMNKWLILGTIRVTRMIKQGYCMSKWGYSFQRMRLLIWIIEVTLILWIIKVTHII